MENHHGHHHHLNLREDRHLQLGLGRDCARRVRSICLRDCGVRGRLQRRNNSSRPRYIILVPHRYF